MKKYVSFFLPALLIASVWLAHAEEGHDHGDSDQSQGNTSQRMHGEHGHGEDDAHHQHESWIDPPEAYARKVSDAWTDADAIARGEEIYQQHCSVCHGADGQGTGPMAQALSHPPADLTHDFHTSPGDGDAYLFWRVSEGGTVEPFKSQGSQMPAFKEILTESERWDVLAYVHTFFHQDLIKWQQSGVGSEPAEESGS